MSAPLTIQPRCPSCWAPTEGDRCGLCHIERCPETGCGELRVVGAAHEHSATCAECGDRFLVGEGCTGHLDGDYCGSHYALVCGECRQGTTDDMAAEAAEDRWTA